MIENYVAITDHVVTLDSEADMEFFLNNVDLTGIIWSVVAKGGQFTFVAIEGGPVVPPEVAAVLARYSALTQQETDAITKFVSNELQAVGNNWTKRDEVFAWALNATDWLIGMKAATATNNGAVRSDEGATTDGVATYIDSNVIPNNLAQYLQNNARAASYVIRMAAAFGNRSIFGAADASGLRLIRIQHITAALMNSGLNATQTNNYTLPKTTAQYGVVRRSATHNGMLFNGADVAGGDRVSTGRTSNSIYVGARSNNLTADHFINATQAMFSIGAGVGMDEAAAQTNELELLIDLGVFINPVLARYTGLSQQEIDAITKYVNNEARVGNWQRQDDFLCFALVNTPANALIGMKAATATNSGAVLSIQGALFNGTSDFITSNVTPSNGSNYQLNSAFYGVFTLENDNNPALGFILDGGGNLGMRNATDVSSQTHSVQIGVNTAGLTTARSLPLGVQPSQLLIAAKQDAANVQLYADGQLVDTRPFASTALASANIRIGARGNGSSFYGGRVASFVIGGTVGMDMAAHYTNHLELLIDLGVFVNPVLARYSALSAGEIAAITKYVNNEVRASNWQRTSEVFVWCLNATDRLIGMRSKTSIPVGAPTFGANGVTLNGTTQWMRSGFTPSVDNATPYQPNNAMFGMFMLDVSPNGYMGSSDNDGGRNNMIVAGTGINFSVESLTGVGTLNVPNEVANTAGRLYMATRPNGTTITAFRDGVQLGNNPFINGRPALSDNEILFGAQDQGFTQGNQYTGTIPSAVIGAPVGFDQVAHNTNHRQLLIDLGVTLP